MNRFKIVLCFVLVSILIFNVSLSFAEEVLEQATQAEENNIESDNSNEINEVNSSNGTDEESKNENAYERPAIFLSKIDIMQGYEDGTLKLSESVTRAEFCALIIRILGLESDIENSELSVEFTDVNSDHWAASSIKSASDIGIISGYGDGNFGPDDSISFEQAVKMSVYLLGYDVYAQNMGGYPAGYLAVAAQKGITKGIKIEFGKTINRGEVAKLIYNSLEVDLMKQTNFGSQSQYTIEKGKTLLTEYLKIIKAYGIVTSTSDSSFVGGNILNKKDEVEISGYLYKVGSTDAKKFLGQRVVFYFKENDAGNSKHTILDIEVDENEDNTLIINALDISEETTKEKLIYWEDRENKRETKEINLSGSIQVINNGKLITNFSADKIKPSSGKIKLTDVASDGEYDFIIVTSYDTYVVERVNKIEKIISFKHNKAGINLDSYSKYSIVKDNKSIDIDELSQWDVLSIEKSSDMDYINIIVSNNVIEGSVEEIETTSDKVKIKIGYETFSVAKGSYDDQIKIGDLGKFYLNIDNEVATIDKTAQTDENYAYLLYGAKKGLSVQFKLLTAEGKIKILDTANRIKINDTSQPAVYILDEILKDEDGKFIPQLIKYKVNSEDELSSIDTAGIIFDKYKFTKDSVLAKASYGSRSGMFDALYKLDSNTKVFLVPQGEVDDDKYKAGSRSLLVDHKQYTNVEMYDLTDFNVAGAIVIKEEAQSQAGLMRMYELPITLVDKITTIINDDGEKEYKLYGLQNGREISYLADNEDVYDNGNNSINEDNRYGYLNTKLKDLSKGDIIMFNRNDDGLIDNIRILYRSGMSPHFILGAGEYNHERLFSSAYGTVYKMDSQTLLLEYNDFKRPFNLPSRPRVYLFDQRSNSIKNSSFDEVNEGDNVFIHIRSNSVFEIVITR